MSDAAHSEDEETHNGVQPEVTRTSVGGASTAEPSKAPTLRSQIASLTADSKGAGGTVMFMGKEWNFKPPPPPDTSSKGGQSTEPKSE